MSPPDDHLPPDDEDQFDLDDMLSDAEPPADDPRFDSGESNTAPDDELVLGDSGATPPVSDAPPTPPAPGAEKVQLDLSENEPVGDAAAERMQLDLSEDEPDLSGGSDVLGPEGAPVNLSTESPVDAGSSDVLDGGELGPEEPIGEPSPDVLGGGSDVGSGGGGGVTAGNGPRRKAATSGLSSVIAIAALGLALLSLGGSAWAVFMRPTPVPPQLAITALNVRDSGVVGRPVRLRASVIGAESPNFAWTVKKPDGSPVPVAPNANAVFTPDIPGEYGVSLVVTDAEQRTATESASTVITEPSVPRVGKWELFDELKPMSADDLKQNLDKLKQLHREVMLGRQKSDKRFLTGKEIARAIAWAKTVQSADSEVAFQLEMIKREDGSYGHRGVTGPSPSDNSQHRTTLDQIAWAVLSIRGHGVLTWLQIDDQNLTMPEALANNPNAATDQRAWNDLVAIKRSEEMTRYGEAAIARQLAFLAYKSQAYGQADSLCDAGIGVIERADDDDEEVFADPAKLLRAHIRLLDLRERIQTDSAGKTVNAAGLQQAIDQLNLPGGIDGSDQLTDAEKQALRDLLTKQGDFTPQEQQRVRILLAKMKQAGGQGPAGPAGPTGPVGPAGPAGPGGTAPVDRTAVNTLLTKLADRISRANVQVQNANAATLQQRLTTLSRQVQDLQGLGKQQMPIQKSTELDDDLRRALDEITAIEFEYLAGKTVPSLATVESISGFLNKLQLIPSTNLERLKPGTRPTWISDSQDQRHRQLFEALSADLDAIQQTVADAGDGDIPNQRSDGVLDKLRRISYAVLTLENRKLLEHVPTDGSPGPERKPDPDRKPGPGAGPQPGIVIYDGRGCPPLPTWIPATSMVGQTMITAQADVAALRAEMQGQLAAHQQRMAIETARLEDQRMADQLQVQQELAAVRAELQVAKDTVVDRALGALAAFGYTGPKMLPDPPPAPPADPTRIEPRLDSPNPLLAQDLYGKGYSALFDGHVLQAADYLRAAVRNAPDNPTYHYFYALALRRNGRTIEARAQARAGRLLEKTRVTTRQVDRALERIQGGERSWLETMRHPT